MAYEKYIKKDGRVYGPYIYHSKRVDGKVISEYHGQKKFDFIKFFWLIPLVALIIFGAYLIGQQGKKATGYSILGINADYQEGGPLEGNLNFLLQQGELVPAGSTVVFENAGQRQEYLLGDLVSEPSTEGNFFVNGKNLSGSGAGFGLAGTKTISPDVSFVLLIYSAVNETENTESEREVSSFVTKDNGFTYELQASERAELKPRSVLSGGKQLNDDAVSLIIEGNAVFVTTQYTEEEPGFGADYKGKEAFDLTIDLNQLDLILQPGVLDVSVIYSSEKLVSLQTTIGEGDVSGQAEIIPEEILGEQIPEQAEQTSGNETNITEIPIRELSLTPEEKTALENEFGNISLTAKKATLKNGFKIIRYELGNLWIEYSYDAELSDGALSGLMEADRIKWLKDIAQGLLQAEEPAKEVNLLP